MEAIIKQALEPDPDPDKPPIFLESITLPDYDRREYAVERFSGFHRAE